jgi:cyanophycin synthetase
MHPENISFCKEFQEVFDICGVDIMGKNLTQPLKENGGCILEVNAAPGFRMHCAAG